MPSSQTWQAKSRRRQNSPGAMIDNSADQSLKTATPLTSIQFQNSWV